MTLPHSEPCHAVRRARGQPRVDLRPKPDAPPPQADRLRAQQTITVHRLDVSPRAAEIGSELTYILGEQLANGRIGRAYRGDVRTVVRGGHFGLAASKDIRLLRVDGVERVDGFPALSSRYRSAFPRFPRRRGRSTRSTHALRGVA